MPNEIEAQFALLQPGLVIGPDHHRFKLVERLVPFALGQQWQAEDISTSTPTPVTLLFLNSALLSTSGFKEKFRDLLNQNKNLKNPHIARCFGTFHYKQLFFSSWEKLDGRTIADMLDRNQARKLNAKQKQGLITQVAKALEAGRIQSHAPHATLGPDFIYLNRQGGIKILGFNWRPLIDDKTESFETPVRYRGWQSNDAFYPNLLDAREDVHALACLVYQLYGGKAPYPLDADDRERKASELKTPDGLTVQQWNTLRKALSHDPEERPDTPLALAKALYTETPEESETPIAEAEAMLPDAEDDSEEVDDSASKKSTKRKLSITWPKLAPRVGYPLLFTTGAALGAALMWWWQQHTLADTLKAVQEELGQTQIQLASSQQQLAAGKAKITDLQAALENARLGPTSNDAPVDPNEPPTNRGDVGQANNLMVFHDEIAPGQFAPQMVVLPKGRFQMGDIDGNGDDNEYPVHQVTISKPFALSRYEVTFADYDRFAEATNRAKPEDHGWGRGNLPVVNVSWNDAMAYTRWLGEQTGQPYRLPTEAEWEYASRASTETLFWWGNKMAEGEAVCDGCGTQWDGKRPAPVGSFAATPWGIHDLNGNVYEWVQDCYRPTYEGAPTDGSAVGGSCEQRVMRGGSWFDIPRLVRSASRYRAAPDAKLDSWGFRLALDLPENMQP